MKPNKVIYIVFLSIIVIFTIQAQENTNLRDVYFDAKSNQILKVYFEKGDEYYIQEGPYKTYPKVDFFLTVEFQNKTQITLARNEQVIGVSYGLMLTKTVDPVTLNNSFKSYKIKSNRFEIISVIQLTGELSSSICENGTIIITDEWESFGTTINIYNSKLILLNSFNPFKNGFTNSRFISNGNKIISLVGNENIKRTKYFEINTSSGKIELESQLDTYMNPVKLLKVNDILTAVESTRIIGIKQSKIIWSKEVTLPTYDISGNSKESILYYFTDNKLTKISAIDGVILAEIDLSKLYNHPISEGKMLRPVQYYSDEKSGDFLFILAESNKGKLDYNIQTKNPQIFTLNSMGSIYENKELYELNPGKIYNIDIHNNKIRILSENQTIILK